MQLLCSQDLRVDQESKSWIEVIIRELDRVSSIYAKLLIYTIVPLIYSKGYMSGLQKVGLVSFHFLFFFLFSSSLSILPLFYF